MGNVLRPLSLAVVLAARMAMAQDDTSITIKFATLAPEGTVWYKAIKQGDEELRKASDGKMRFKIYSGGTQGDEKDTIRKMRNGQLHATGVTGAGLAEIVPEVHVFDVPALFEDGAEVDYVLEKMFPEFQKMFEAKGFHLLGFTEAGFVYFYSQLPLAAPADFRASNVKAWVWEGDLLNQSIFDAFKVPSVPLALPDVLVGLQTGMVNTVFGPPAGAVAMQWHTKVRYMTPRPLAWGVGGTIITDKLWRQLTPEQQKTLSDVTAHLSKDLMSATREDNQKAFAAMQKLGIELTRKMTPEEDAEYRKTAAEARKSLVGSLYSAELLRKVEGLVAEYRASRGSGKP